MYARVHCDPHSTQSAAARYTGIVAPSQMTTAIAKAHPRHATPRRRVPLAPTGHRLVFPPPRAPPRVHGTSGFPENALGCAGCGGRG